MNPRKLLQRILSGSRNVRFCDMVMLVRAFGFQELRITGSHHIFGHPDVDELVNLQEVGGQAKPYQIRQFLGIIEEYDLSLEEDS